MCKWCEAHCSRKDAALRPGCLHEAEVSITLTAMSQELSTLAAVYKLQLHADSAPVAPLLINHTIELVGAKRKSTPPRFGRLLSDTSGVET